MWSRDEYVRPFASLLLPLLVREELRHVPDQHPEVLPAIGNPATIVRAHDRPEFIGIDRCQWTSLQPRRELIPLRLTDREFSGERSHDDALTRVADSVVTLESSRTASDDGAIRTDITEYRVPV